MLRDISLDTMINTLYKRMFLTPTFREETLLLPRLQEFGKRGIAKVVIDDGDYTIPVKERVRLFDCIITIHTPVCRGVELHMLGSNTVEPKKN